MSDVNANNRAKFYEIINTFKDQICNLLNDKSLDLTEKQRQENIRKFENLHEKIKLAKLSNSKLAIELFYRGMVVPYGTYILRQDDNFFMTQTDLVSGSDEVQYGLFIEELKSIWKLLDSNNKKVIWRYMLALSKLSDAIMGENYLERLKAKNNAN